jgi:hypothetical protein
VHIVVLELFMDVGASVAFVSDPTPPGTMDRPPRDPASRFLDATQLSAIAVTRSGAHGCGAPRVSHHPRPVGHRHGDRGRRGRVAHRECGDRVEPARPTGSAVAAQRRVSGVALVALVAAFILSLTQAEATLGVEPLSADAVRITVGVAAVGVAIAAAGRLALSLSRRL